MEAEALIRYKLGLVLRMIDSVSGKLITIRDVRFLVPDGIGPPVPKGEGVYLFMNIPRKDFRLEVNIYGYEPVKTVIDFSRIDERMPAAEIFMVPKDELPRSESMLSLEGTLTGIESIECIPLRNVAISIKDYEKESRVMTLFNPHGESFEYARYGIPNEEFTEYEELDVKNEISKQKVELRTPLERDWYPDQPIMRIIPGIVRTGGNFVLRVPKGRNAEYLVCIRQAGMKRFKKVDFLKVSENGGVTWES